MRRDSCKLHVAVPHLRSSFGEDLTDGEVEDIEGSKCRLDDAEQASAVVWLEALGVERIEGGEDFSEVAKEFKSSFL